MAPYFWASCEHLEGVERGSGRASEDADDEVRVVANQLLHRLRSVIDDLEERRPAARGDPREHPGDHVVEVGGQDRRVNRAWDVGVEDFEEVAELLPLGLLAELVEPLERGEIEGQVVVEGHAVQAEVGAEGSLLGRAIEVAALDVVEAGRAERPGRLLGVARASGDVDVGRVVRPGGRGDGGIFEHPLANRQGVVGAGRHQHDVDHPLLDDGADLLAIFFEGLEPDLAVVGLGRLPRGADAEGHVGILGVGEDELATG